MTSPRFAASLIILLLIAAPAHAQQSTAAGRVKVVTGQAFIVRNADVLAAQPGQLVFESDSLRTGSNGTIGVTLKDDTRVSLGPSSEVRVDRFAYASADGSLGLVLKIVRGVTAYVSGRIAKLAPDSVRLETPSAIVGVRGTRLVIRAGD
jgi:hypothetical protein